jgi:hypothetical protein
MSISPGPDPTATDPLLAQAPAPINTPPHERPQHNHITRDIKAEGKCPACDAYWHHALTQPEGPQ